MDWRVYWKESVAALVAGVMLWIAFAGGNRIPLLGSFDLGIHELGHLITLPLGEVAYFLMGSGLQVLVPLGLAGYFWFWQHDRLSSGLLMVWGATSMQDVGVYIADAPYQSLQLIGGTHDWWYLLSHFGKIAWANEISRGVWLVGLAVGVIGLGLIVAPPAMNVWGRLGDGTDMHVRNPGPTRVRERRQPQ